MIKQYWRPFAIAILALAAVTAVACSSDDSSSSSADTSTSSGSAVQATTSTSTPNAGGTTAASPATTAATTKKVSANNSSRAELQATFEAAGIPAAANWAKKVEEYRPYPADDANYTKLRQNLAKYNPAPGIVDQIIAVLQQP